MPLKTAVGAERDRDLFLWSVKGGLDTSMSVPDPIEFVLSDRYLKRNLYPRQGTLLKAMFLRDDMFTQFDLDVIGEWEGLWQETEDEGTPPNLLERIKICQSEGRPWFRDNISILGRRSGKNYLGALAGAYVLWHYLARGDPQHHYGIDRDKHFGIFVFAAKKELAIKQQWGDLANAITGGPCFHKYLTKTPRVGDLRVFAPNDYVRIAERTASGVVNRPEDMATFEILPKESTKVSARGPALCALLFDEMAHVTRQVARASADEVWDQATPALDTFKNDAWIYEASSPEAKTGQFYANSVEAQRVSDGTDGLEAGSMARPEIFVIQLPSWSIYDGFREAHTVPLRPHQEETYPPQRNAPQEYDDQMRRLSVQNPTRFRIERLSKWASVADAYFHEERVDAMFVPWPEDQPLNDGNPNPTLVTDYVMHIDPSHVGDNTGLAIAHAVRLPGADIPHVILDVIGHWKPGDFPENGNEIDYEFLVFEIWDLIRRFVPVEVSFDQGSSSSMMIQVLRKMVAQASLPKRVQVFERTATLQSNWAVAESTKVALQLGVVHAPYDQLLRDEMLFLQLTGTGTGAKRVDHPSSGPVQSKDVFDAASTVIHALIGKNVARLMGDQFMATGISASQQGGFMMPMTYGPDKDSAPRRPVAEVAEQMHRLNQGRINGRIRSGGPRARQNPMMPSPRSR